MPLQSVILAYMLKQRFLAHFASLTCCLRHDVACSLPCATLSQSSLTSRHSAHAQGRYPELGTHRFRTKIYTSPLPSQQYLCIRLPSTELSSKIPVLAHDLGFAAEAQIPPQGSLDTTEPPGFFSQHKPPLRATSMPASPPATFTFCFQEELKQYLCLPLSHKYSPIQTMPRTPVVLLPQFS